MFSSISVCEAKMMLDQAHKILIRMKMELSDGNYPKEEDITSLHRIIEKVNLAKWTTNYY